MTLAIPLLLLLIGLALIAGRKAPMIPVALAFMIVGMYAGDTWLGQQITSGLDIIARVIQ